MGLQMFLSLVARAATLGNSCNLHKCKMAAMDSGFASGWDTIQLIYFKSCVTPLYQIIFTRGIDFLGNFVIRGQSIGQMSSSSHFRSRNVRSTYVMYIIMFLALKTSSPQQKHHSMNP